MLWKKAQEETHDYIIRKADPSDAAGIISCMQSVMDERIYLVGEYYLLSERAEQERIKSLDDLTLVCVIDRKVVGVLTVQRGIYRKNRHTGMLGIAIMAGHRHKGLGTRMIKEAILWCEDQGIKKLNLEVFSTNVNAIKTYEKVGFEVEGKRRKQFLIDGQYVDDVLMTYYVDKSLKE
ncbi:N-terminal acetyltransferase complex subunit [ARD1] [Thermoplasma volcanium GSS1]|uniref:N-terminal acetyltransferase complex subunit [ARD1] n=1 Tax=Thermoplasma volcanium (strain ATCC 51530 / DSM 4299 / JCM 9571 / NBRC 15438 / GSS1) TaxID=273116 RepID=Q978R7_THEVO|nr:GNAT family N-acetyltransferase [Thermoplasma volcanium]BAB60490.1 N-terminal acetyltransferase complex subunit [ARD1] [Thermoplasma volcanium GSS1]